jgi:hypothetical protein
MELIGRVLWWSDRDENGIIVDPLGNEFYFDRSVLQFTNRKAIARDTVLFFQYNKSIKDCLCAFNVKLPSSTKKKSLEKKFREQSRLGSNQGISSEQ